MESKLYVEAQRGIELLEMTIAKLLKMNKEGMGNSEIAKQLGLESSHESKQKNYLTYSILGNMMEKKLVEKIKVNGKSLYRLNQ